MTLSNNMPDAQRVVTLGTGWLYTRLTPIENIGDELALILPGNELVDFADPQSDVAPWDWVLEHEAAEAGMFLAVP